jgi:signal transduction histidine kinase/CheY-like chemotaxis protein
MSGNPIAPWRESLLRRLSVLCALVMTMAVLSAVASSSGRLRLTMLGFAPLIGLQTTAVFRPAWPYRMRGGIVVASFLASSLLVYAVVGFQGSGQLVAAVAVIAAVLLFGRRQAAVVVGLLLAGVASAGVGMVTRRLPLPDPASVSLSAASAWTRTTLVALLLWLLVGSAVAFAVEHIERAARAVQDALTTLREEQGRREEADVQRVEAERVAQQAQKQEMIGRLAAGVAHDFNNLLAVVQCWTELGAKPSADAAQRAEERAAILAACKQGAALSRQLLTIGRRSTRSVLTLDLGEAVDSAVLVLSRILPEDIELTVEHRGAPAVQADEMDLQQVTLNFVVNARDAMPGGGRLRIMTGVRDVTADEALVGGRLTAGRWAFVTVEDSGPGVDPAIRQRIFEPFFTTKPPENGTGLGLATVLHIARESGGAVGLDSEPGRGARFSFYLPAARAEGISTAGQAPTVRAVPPRSARVLIVEDNVGVRRVMQSILERSGHHVISASDGDRALQIIGASQELDLLCTDGVLPGAPASTVIAAFEAAHRGRPILIVSGYLSDELAARGVREGRHRLLRKPFSPTDLCVAVDELLQQGGTVAPRVTPVPSCRRAVS